MKESHNPSSSTLMLVRQKAGEIRLCADHRRLNGVIMHDCFSLPTVDDTLNRLAGTRWFLILDLNCSYLHIALHTSDKKKAASLPDRDCSNLQFCPLALQRSRNVRAPEVILITGSYL